jgi:Domain of unknown function (DUF4262)
MITKPEQQVLDNIEAFGFSIMHVKESKKGEVEEPGFSYTIGLFKNYQLPELLIIGLDQELRHTLIDNISLDYPEGKGLEVGAYNADIVESFDCLVVEVAQEYYDEYLGWARWFYKGDAFPAVQVIYPDLLGLFPWDKDFSRFIKQPVLNAQYQQGL